MARSAPRLATQMSVNAANPLPAMTPKAPSSVAMLTHVFDPPPDRLSAPWPFLAALGGAALLGAVLAAALAASEIRRFRLGGILREE